MIQLENTTYNSETDGITPIMVGVYPAHVSGLEVKDVTTRAGENKQVFNIMFLIDDSVEKMNVCKLVKNNDGEFVPAKNEDGSNQLIPATFMKGKKFSSIGLWLTPEPAPDKRWQNRKYVESFEILGIEFPKNKKGDSQLAVIEEEDVIGKPCYIKLDKKTWKAEGETRSTWKAFEVFPWKDGVTLDSDEVKTDGLPF